MSKVIVFDLDETLRSLETSAKDHNDVKVVLRPKIIDLLQKISDIKKQGVDSVIFTSASISSVQQYFLGKLPEEYRNVFTQVIGKENFLQPKPNTREKFLCRHNTNKIVTALDYDEILFFDDNIIEFKFLQELYNENLGTKHPVPNKSVSFVSLPFYPRREVEMYALKELAKECEKSKNNEISKKIKNYFDLMTQEPGCKIMAEIIDDFISKDHESGLLEIYGIEEFDKFEKDLKDTYRDIEDTIDGDINLADKYRDYEDEYYEKIEQKEDVDMLEIF